MLKTRVIPVLLVKEMGLVKGANFLSWRRVGPVLPAVRVFDLRDVDELVILDVEATSRHRCISEHLVSQIASASAVPLSVGGGVSSLGDAARLFNAGADRVVINSAAYVRPSLVQQLALTYGSQSVVVSIDAKNGSSGWLCWSESGSKCQQISPQEWGRRVEDLGAGEVLLTSIDHEGLMKGYALDLIAEVSESIAIPVIASGGAGSVSDVKDAVVRGGASAVAAGSLFHFTAITPQDLKRGLSAASIATREPPPQM